MTMKRKLIPLAIAAAFALPIAGVNAQQQQQTAAAASKQPAGILASDLIGKKVVNSQGVDLGEVQDLAVNMRDNRVSYAMLDAQNKMFAYPLRTLKLSADGDRIVLNVSEEQLEKAPGMDRSLLGGDTTGNDAYWRDVDRYWRTVERDAASQAKPSPQLVWGSKLVGWNVQAQDGSNSIGEIKDLVIDPKNGAVRFAAVDFNDSIGGGSGLSDRLQPLPLDAFATREGGDDLVLSVDRSKLQAAQGFDDDKLDERMTDRAFIDKAARYADALTPGTRVSSR